MNVDLIYLILCVLCARSEKYNRFSRTWVYDYEGGIQKSFLVNLAEIQQQNPKTCIIYEIKLIDDGNSNNDDLSKWFHFYLVIIHENFYFYLERTFESKYFIFFLCFSCIVKSFKFIVCTNDINFHHFPIYRVCKKSINIIFIARPQSS